MKSNYKVAIALVAGAAIGAAAIQGLHAQSFPPEAFKLFRQRFLGGHGVYPLIGDADDVAAELAKISAADGE